MYDDPMEIHHRSNLLIWVALIMTMFSYIVVAFLVLPEQNGEVDPILFGAMAMVSFSVVAVIPFLRKTMLGTDQMLGSDPESGFKLAIQKYRTAEIITWAMIESVSIFGFVVCFLSSNLHVLYGFTALGLMLMAYYRPDKEKMRTFANAVTPEGY